MADVAITRQRRRPDGRDSTRSTGRSARARCRDASESEFSLRSKYSFSAEIYLPAPGIYLYIDKPPPKTLVKSIRSLFSGRRAQVLHALLFHRQAWFGVTELSRLSQVSPATASHVLTELERFDWLASRGQGPNKERKLGEPAALLDAWVKRACWFPHETTRSQ